MLMIPCRLPQLNIILVLKSCPNMHIPVSAFAAILKATMDNYLQQAKEFARSHKKELLIGTGVAAVILVVGLVVALFAYNNRSTIVYQPAVACDMFTPQEAQDLLGDRVIAVDTAKPQLSKSGNTATSKCSYTDTVSGNLTVAAVAIRTGVNDAGTKLNREDFAKSKANNETKPVYNLGEDAYFNPTSGQLHVLKGHDWFILSYGIGTTPGENKLADALKLAEKLSIKATAPELPTF